MQTEPDSGTHGSPIFYLQIRKSYSGQRLFAFELLNMCWPSGCQLSQKSCGRNKVWFLMEVMNLQRTLNRKSLSVYKKGNLIKQTQKRYLESGGKHRLCFKNTGGGRNLFERAEAQQQIKLQCFDVAVFWISVRQFQVGLDGVTGCSEHMTLQGPKHHSGSQSTWYLRYSRK